MHFIQDNYYVMNKGSIGMWWLEATATQADRMAWGNSLTYSESELFAIESNSALLENLSKSWDDCNSNPTGILLAAFCNTFQPIVWAKNSMWLRQLSKEEWGKFSSGHAK